jgi:hypothetical protein
MFLEKKNSKQSHVNQAVANSSEHFFILIFLEKINYQSNPNKNKTYLKMKLRILLACLACLSLANAQSYSVNVSPNITSTWTGPLFGVNMVSHPFLF